jgi:hypothetical protein
MKPIERILTIVLLAVCAISLSIIAIQGISAATVQSARADYIETIRTQTVQNLDDAAAAIQTYQDTAYGGKVDRIAEQQLLATETTNAMLAKVVNQVVLLTLLLLE